MNKIPTLSKAQEMLEEAVLFNPGNWKEHSLIVASCAEKIAKNISYLDPEVAYILGLLHDIGRRYGVTAMRHIYDGYKYLTANNYDSSARICLTHSFPIKPIESYSGKNDCTIEEIKFIKQYLQNVEYTDYDKLIQLCDALAYPTGVCTVEKRLIDVAIRNGINLYSVDKWKAFLGLRDYFSQKINKSIYELFEIVL